MSNFNASARVLDEIAKNYFKAYSEAKTAFDYAQKQYNNNRKPSGVGVWKTDAAEIARVTKIEADFAKARADLEYVERTLANEAMEKIAEERRKLVADTRTAFLADPSKIDAATMTLIDSGILTASEYEALMDNAERSDNYTMARLIGHAAGKKRNAMSENEIKLDAEKRMESVKLTEVHQRGRNVGPGRYLDDFDNATAIFKRSMSNPNIAEKWEEYTKNFVENF